MHYSALKQKRISVYKLYLSLKFSETTSKQNTNVTFECLYSLQIEFNLEFNGRIMPIALL